MEEYHDITPEEMNKLAEEDGYSTESYNSKDVNKLNDEFNEKLINDLHKSGDNPELLDKIREIQNMLKESKEVSSETNGTIERLLMSFNRDSEFQELRNRYNTPTILDVLGVGRGETSHSAFLAWLLQGNGIISDAKNTPMMHFLDILVRRNDEQGADKLNTDIRRAIIGRSTTLSDIHVYKEKAICKLPGIPSELKECKDRIDIFATACFSPMVNNIKNLVIVIENKVKSDEGKEKKHKNKFGKVYEASEQTKRYYLAVMPHSLEKEYEKYGNDDSLNIESIEKGNVEYRSSIEGDTCYIFVYLTPLPSSLLDCYDNLDCENKAACPQYIQINYQDIADEIILPLINFGNQSERVSSYLKDYMNALTIPGRIDSNDEDEKSQEILIMATLPSDRKALYDFYHKYYPVVEKTVWLSAKSVPDELKDYIVNVLESDCSISSKMLEDICGTSVIYKNDSTGKSTFIRDNCVINKNVLRKYIKDILDSELSDELNLLKIFKEQNLSIVSAALNILSDAYPTDEKINNLYDMVSRRTPRTKYIFNGQTIIGHTNLVTSIVADYASSHAINDVLKVFNTKKYVKIPANIVYSSQNKPSDNSRYSHKQINCSDGNIICCSNQWDPNNTQQFIKHVRNLGYIIETKM